jgi:glycine/D-amino acid oxidase-like deaminating enzyme
VNYRSDLPPAADLVIVGGGVVGAATAFHAAKAGLRPLLLEARPALCTLTTPVAAGAFRLQFDNLEELLLVRESVRLFLDFEELTGQRDYRLDLRQQGYLWAATDQVTAERQERLVARLHAWGQDDVELLDGEEARLRFPYLGADVVQVRFRAGDGFLDTKGLTFGLAAGSGAVIVPRCRVTGFELTGGRLRGVRTTMGTVDTRAAVIAAGPFSGPVAATAGLTLPVVTVRRHKLWMPDLDVVPPQAPMTIDEQTGAHWRPAFGGAWILYTDPSTPPGPPREAVTPDPGFAFQVLDPDNPASVARIVPFWRSVWEHGANHWVLQAGQYTVTPDHRPILGPTGIEGLFVNTGYSGHGIMLSPAASRLVVEIITGEMAAAGNAFPVDRAFDQRPPPTL